MDEPIAITAKPKPYDQAEHEDAPEDVARSSIKRVVVFESFPQVPEKDSF